MGRARNGLGWIVMGMLSWWTSTAAAGDLHVPANHATIQQAIDAAAEGDTIHVAPGTYEETLVVDKYGLTFLSDDTLGATLSGSSLSGSQITIDLADDASKDAPEFHGFRITSQNNLSLGAHRAVKALPVGNNGNRGVTFVQCLFWHNRFGAIEVEDSHLKLIGCEVMSNGWDGKQVDHGAGIFAKDSEVEILASSFLRNWADSAGGALTMRDCDNAVIRNTTFLMNEIADFPFDDNGEGGGAVRINNCQNVTIWNSLFAQNESWGAAEGTGGALSIGGDVGSSVELVHCTVADNIIGIWVDDPSTLTIKNSIVHDNLYDNVRHHGVVTATYSCVQSTLAGPGNVHWIPKFVEPAVTADYRLRESSFCIDAGNNADVPPSMVQDLGGRSRFLDDAEVVDSGIGNSPVVDMGCHERVSGEYPVRYVDKDALPGGNGLTWGTAYTHLQDALAAHATQDFDQIWVAEGSYRPDQGSGLRGPSFKIPSGVRVYGGFEGDELELKLRDWDKHETILSGGIGALGIHDNSFNVVVFDDVRLGTRLDGFTIQKGNADGAAQFGRGAGIRIEDSTVTIQRCKIRDNDAGGRGAGVHTLRSDVDFVNCEFQDNGSGDTGGALFTKGGLVNLVGCLIDGNTALGGGGTYFSDSEVQVLNSTITDNLGSAGQNGGLRGENADVTIKSSIVWDNHAVIAGQTAQILMDSASNLTIDQSCVEDWNGSLGGTGNIGSDPQFFNLPGDDHRIFSSSPCVNAGDTVAIIPWLQKDLQEGERIVDGDVDMGALESCGTELVLESDPYAFGRERFTFETSCGKADGLMVLYISHISNQGGDMFLPLFYDRFDSAGEHEYSFVLAPNLNISGIRIKFQVLGFNPLGNLSASNEVSPTFYN